MNHHCFASLLIFLAALNTTSYGQLPDSDPRVTPVVKAYRKAGPAVVNISTTRVIQVRHSHPAEQILQELFPDYRPAKRKVTSLGSGVIISPYGYIVTNAHVVRQAQSITITLADKRRFAARIVADNPNADLAVLKIIPRDNKSQSKKQNTSSTTAAKKTKETPITSIPAGKLIRFPYLPLGRSDDLMVGETVIAVGNPLGYANTVTTGIVSAVNRELQFSKTRKITGLIQTDASINRGNSGGPLLNIKGELIGINTAIRADAQNIGFAVAVETIRNLLPELLDFQRLKRMHFGVKVRQRGPSVGGVEITAVWKNSPAAEKLLPGDQILALDSRSIQQITDFVFEMLQKSPGDVLQCTVKRNQKTLHVKIPIQARPIPDGKALAWQRLGVKLLKITPALARMNRLGSQQGFVVSQIAAKSPASKIGFRPKDIIFSIDGMYLPNWISIGDALYNENGTPKDSIKIGVLRGNVAVWVVVKLRPEKSEAKKSRSTIAGKESLSCTHEGTANEICHCT